MTKRSLGLAVLFGLPVLAGGALAIHALGSKPQATAVAEQGDQADAAAPVEHRRGKKHHRRHPHARAEKAAKGGNGHAKSIDGAFQRYLVSPRGEPLAVMLADGTIVRLPHGTVANPSLKPGDPLHVEGKAHEANQVTVLAHANISKDGQVIFAADKKGARGDREAHAKLQPMTATGKIIALIPAQKDVVLGVVLDDGTTVLFGRHGDGTELAIKLGDTITVEGKGGSYPIGNGIAAQSIKLPNGETKTFARGKGA
jgi:hypothetical protein